jgi:rhodanese-related sulfurtransferase
MRHMGAAELKSWLSSGGIGVVLLDVREPWEHEICRIEGSRLVPLGQLPERIGELRPDAPTVVVCHHGVRSLRAAAYLERFGFGDVVNLSGGIDAWARSVDSRMATY